MFTGIILEVGKLKKREDSLYVISATKTFIKKLELGTSVAINGACMTVVSIYDEKSFSVEVMPESQKKTTLGNMKINDLINLELPATPETFLSGHIVQGHVDGIGTIKSISDEGISRIVVITSSQEIQKYIVNKGSITVNGVSLTVISSDKDSFKVGIIPYTWEHTMLHVIEIGTEVNLENDIFAKYTEKLLNKRSE